MLDEAATYCRRPDRQRSASLQVAGRTRSSHMRDPAPSGRGGRGDGRASRTVATAPGGMRRHERRGEPATRDGLRGCARRHVSSVRSARRHAPRRAGARRRAHRGRSSIRGPRLVEGTTQASIVSDCVAVGSPLVGASRRAAAAVDRRGSGGSAGARASLDGTDWVLTAMTPAVPELLGVTRVGEVRRRHGSRATAAATPTARRSPRTAQAHVRQGHRRRRASRARRGRPRSSRPTSERLPKVASFTRSGSTLTLKDADGGDAARLPQSARVRGDAITGDWNGHVLLHGHRAREPGGRRPHRDVRRRRRPRQLRVQHLQRRRRRPTAPRSRSARSPRR